MKISIKDIVKAAQTNGASDKDILTFVLKTAAGEAQLGDEEIAQMLQGAGGADKGAPPPGPATAEPPAAPGGPPAPPMPEIPPQADPTAAAGEAGAPPLQLTEQQIQEVVQIILQALEGEAGPGGEAGSPPAGAPPAGAMPKMSSASLELKEYITDFIKQGNDRHYPLDVTIQFLKVALDSARQHQEAVQQEQAQAEQEKYAEHYLQGLVAQAGDVYGLNEQQAVALIQKYAADGVGDTPETGVMATLKNVYNQMKNPTHATVPPSNALNAGGGLPEASQPEPGTLDLAAQAHDKMLQGQQSVEQLAGAGGPPLPPEPSLIDSLIAKLTALKDQAASGAQQGMEAFQGMPLAGQLGVGAAGLAGLGGLGYGASKLMGGSKPEAPAQPKPNAEAKKQPKGQEA